MSQTQVTLDEIMTAVRELTFDRFIIPAFAIKAKTGWLISVIPTVGESTGKILLKKPATEGTEEQTIEFSYSEYSTLESLMEGLIAADIVVAYTPYFKGTEPTSSLIKVTDKSLDTDFTAFRRYFFSDEEIKKQIAWYYWQVLDIANVELTPETMARLQRPSEQHMAIWVSYHLVDKRRLYENAALSIGQSFTDGSDYTGSGLATAPLATTVQIGSVFSITENATEGYFQEDFNRVGSDNVWGDRYSFWYRLMLYLRQLLEETFGDYSLRKTTVMSGYIELRRELDFRSYYDSYPFTLSPLSRGILSKTP